MLLLAVLLILILGEALVLWTAPKVPQPVGLGFAHHAYSGKALGTTFTVVDQIAPEQVPQEVVQGMAAAYGLGYRYGGAPACGQGHSAAGEQVVCIQPIHQRECGRGGCWSYQFFAGGIVLSPALVGQPVWMVEEALCHELGNALGYPEEPPTARNCMAMSMSGFLSPPGR